MTATSECESVRISASVESPAGARFPRAFLLAAIACAALPCQAASSRVQGAQGIEASIDAVTGRYEVRSAQLNWAFAGELGEPASDVSVEDRQDLMGAYQELRFRWHQQPTLSGAIRAYVARPLLVFGITTQESTPDAALLRFPRFTELPGNLHTFSYANREFAPPTFTLEQTGTPWLIFDDQSHAVVLSPAANYMIASMRGDGKTEITSGLNEGVTGLPAGFTHNTIMAFGAGVNITWDAWGRGLTDLQGKRGPKNDADVGLRYLGYWTDNGAYYYYNYDHKLGYAGTLEALARRYHEESIPIRYLQLDSWWYYKTLTDPTGTPGRPKNRDLPPGEWNRYGGLLKYEAHPALFPDGLAGFQKRIGLPLITHNRWIDPASPYRAQYSISGFAAVDPNWWQQIMGYLSSANVVSYEQDWLNVIYEHSPELSMSRSAGDAFTDGMAQAALVKGLTLQYCMPLPRHFLQGARYENLTTIRTSDDRFERRKWDAFLYTSRLASALGIWPWTDVFMSTETDNLLIATLSAGMVGNGDRIGAENKENLLRAVRLDGVIIKPDAPLVPIDGMYVSDAARAMRPMISSTYVDHGTLRTGYVFSYNRGAVAAKGSFTPAQLGLPRSVYIYDARTRMARRLGAADTFVFDLAPNGTAYFILTPISKAGIALLGDESKFVPDGRKRIANLVDEPGALTATVTLAPQERSVRLFGYAERRPTVTVLSGSASELVFDKRTGRFTVSVSPGPQRFNEGPGSDPVLRATLSLQSP
jgi:hypothetical protein